MRVKLKDALTFGEEVEVPVDMVVLATGMVPNDVSDLVDMMKLPVGTDRFLLEVHPKLRPVELPRAGIYLAGTCQAPMDVGEACNGAAAAAKAASLLGLGYVELDPFVAEVDLNRCKGAGACVDACLCEGALRLVEIEVDGQTGGGDPGALLGLWCLRSGLSGKCHRYQRLDPATIRCHGRCDCFR